MKGLVRFITFLVFVGIILLAFLFLMNATAVYVRRKFERKW